MLVGSAEGARKARAYQIEQYGSVERYREVMREKAKAGGAKSSSRPFKTTPGAARKAGKIRAVQMWGKTEIERLKAPE